MLFNNTHNHFSFKHYGTVHKESSWMSTLDKGGYGSIKGRF